MREIETSSSGFSAKISSILLNAFNRISPEKIHHLNPDMPLEQIGLDSLALSEIVLDIEDGLSVTLNDEALADLVNAKTAGDVLTILRSNVVER